MGSVPAVLQHDPEPISPSTGGHFLSASVSLSKVPSELQYGIEQLYDVKPKFTIKAGLVFAPFTRNGCYNQKGHFLVRSQLRLKISEFRTKELPKFVLLTKVLQDSRTAGYDAIRYRMVVSINGLEIFDLDDVNRAFAERGEPFGKEELGKKKHVVCLDEGVQVGICWTVECGPGAGWVVGRWWEGYYGLVRC